MEKIKKFLFFSLVAVMTFGFAGCDNDDSSDDAVVKEGTVEVIEKTENGGTLLVSAIKDDSSGSTEWKDTYLSLSSGEKVDATSAASTSWDLSFKATTLILTNSGATAAELGSSGNGGVVALATTNFSVRNVDVSSLDFTEDMTTDKRVWIVGMGGSEERFVNVMSYPGYSGGDGTEASPYSSRTRDWSAPSEFYHSEGMPPSLSATNEVYVVRHADGVKYSKFKVLGIEYSKNKETKITTYNFMIKYKNFVEEK